MKVVFAVATCSMALSLAAGQWAKPEPIPREKGLYRCQIHVRTDLSRPDPFCPSTPFIRRAIALLHRHGVTVQGVTWTEGTNADVHKRLWDIGFDHFTSDYPEFFAEFCKTIRKD